MLPSAEQVGEAPACSVWSSLWDFQHPSTPSLWWSVFPRISVPCRLGQPWEGRHTCAWASAFAQTHNSAASPGTADGATPKPQRETDLAQRPRPGASRGPAPLAQSNAPNSGWTPPFPHLSRAWGAPEEPSPGKAPPWCHPSALPRHASQVSSFFYLKHISGVSSGSPAQWDSMTSSPLRLPGAHRRRQL